MGFIQQLLSVLPVYTTAIWLSVILPLGFLVRRQYFSPLRKIPGPFWAGLTDLWRLLMVLRGRPHEEQRALHDKYGDVVRLGPNTLSFSNPQAVGDIYSGKSRNRKVRRPDSASGQDAPNGRFVFSTLCTGG